MRDDPGSLIGVLRGWRYPRRGTELGQGPSLP